MTNFFRKTLKTVVIFLLISVITIGTNAKLATKIFALSAQKENIDPSFSTEIIKILYQA